MQDITIIYFTLCCIYSDIAKKSFFDFVQSILSVKEPRTIMKLFQTAAKMFFALDGVKNLLNSGINRNLLVIC